MVQCGHVDKQAKVFFSQNILMGFFREVKRTADINFFQNRIEAPLLD